MTALNDGMRASRATPGAALGPVVLPGQCPAPELLRAAAEGVLPDDLAARVSTHRTACAWCDCLQSALTELDITKPTNAERRRIRARMGVALTGSSS